MCRYYDPGQIDSLQLLTQFFAVETPQSAAKQALEEALFRRFGHFVRLKQFAHHFVHELGAAVVVGKRNRKTISNLAGLKLHVEIPKVGAECEFLQFGGCRQVEAVSFIAETERLRDPEKGVDVLRHHAKIMNINQLIMFQMPEHNFNIQGSNRHSCWLALVHTHRL